MVSSYGFADDLDLNYDDDEVAGLTEYDFDVPAKPMERKIALIVQLSQEGSAGGGLSALDIFGNNYMYCDSWDKEQLLRDSKFYASLSEQLRKDVNIINQVLGFKYIEKMGAGVEAKYRINQSSKFINTEFSGLESVWLQTALLFLKGDYSSLKSKLAGKTNASLIDAVNLEVKNQIDSRTVDIYSAILNRQRIVFDYTNIDGICNVRKVEPYQLGYFDGFFYLQAKDMVDDRVKLFKLIRFGENFSVEPGVNSFFPEFPLPIFSLEVIYDELVFAVSPRASKEIMLLPETLDATPILGENYHVPQGWDVYSVKGAGKYAWLRLALEYLDEIIIISPSNIIDSVVEAAKHLSGLEVILDPGLEKSHRIPNSSIKKSKSLDADNQIRQLIEAGSIASFVINTISAMQPDRSGCYFLKLEQITRHFSEMPARKVKDYLGRISTNPFMDYSVNNLSFELIGETIKVSKGKKSEDWYFLLPISQKEAAALTLALELLSFYLPSQTETMDNIKIKLLPWLSVQENNTIVPLVTQRMPVKLEALSKLIGSAIDSKKTMLLDYVNSSKPVHVAPKAVQVSGNKLYLNGFNLDSRKWHLYRLDRIKHAEVDSQIPTESDPPRRASDVRYADVTLKLGAKPKIDMIFPHKLLECAQPELMRVRLYVYSQRELWLQRTLQSFGADVLSISTGKTLYPAGEAVLKSAKNALSNYGAVN